MKTDTLYNIALGVLVFAVFAAGACPTIYVGDSGELVTAVHVLGIPHPSGYPLYVLLGKLWTLVVPLGSIAYRMSLFSALCAAATCMLTYRLCRVWQLDRNAALGASLLLAFSASFWSQANIQRVYALNAVFVVGATLATTRWLMGDRARPPLLAFFLCGLGACNHTFMGVYAVVLAIFVAWTAPASILRARGLLTAATSVVVGLLPYAYLPLRSRFDPRLDWGNPETLHGFMKTVLREDFWSRAWIERPADLLPITGDYITGLGHELTWLGVAIAAVGLAVAWRRRRLGLLLALLMAANLATMALHGSRSDLFIWHRYYIPSYVIAALLVGVGWDALTGRLAARAATWIRPLILVLPIVLLANGWRSYDRSHYRIAESFSNAVLDSLPPGATLIATDDNVLFVLMYLQFVENRRPDVDLILQGVGDAELPPLHFNPDTDAVFFTHHPNWNVAGLDIVPLGVVFQALRSGRPWPEAHVTTLRLEGEDDPAVPKDYLTQNLIGLFHYMLGFTFERSDWPRARREFQEAARTAPDNDVLFYNLGLIYWRAGLLDDALDAFARCNEINPRHLASASRPRAADRIIALKAERGRLARIEQEITASAPVASLAPGSAAYHMAIADALAARGEQLAAGGQRRLAEESTNR